MSQLDTMMTPGPLPPSRHRRTWGRRLVALASVGILLAMVGAAFVLLRGSGETTDYAGPGTGETSVIVARGDTLTEIGRKLAEAGVVLSADAFLNVAEVDDRAASIGPGRYTLREQMSASAALELMLDPESRADSRLVLPEGLRLEQTVSTAAEVTSLPKSDFQKVLQDPAELDLPAWAKDRPEGFMFPASYDLTGDETAKSVLRQLVKRFNQASADVGIEQRAADVGLSPYQVLVVASLLQAEAAPNDFAKVARVIYNRLDADMPLQLDSTVSYALGVSELQLSAEQLETSSPYNTYVRRGLPGADGDVLHAHAAERCHRTARRGPGAQHGRPVWRAAGRHRVDRPVSHSGRSRRTRRPGRTAPRRRTGRPRGALRRSPGTRA